MYQEFYGLKEKPFVLTPDPQFLYLGECHRTAMESLLYGIHQRQGFMVVVGDIGTGKTTICRALLGKLDENVKAAVIFNSFLTEEELLESILHEYGLPSQGRSRKERIDALNTLFLHYLSQNKNALLIIDEAQHLSIPVLEQIRMLSNLETEKEKMLQIVLVGQPELDQKLKSPELRQLNQRIAIRQHLRPLTRTEMESYIYQRLQVAGANGDIAFSKTALDEIYKLSRGTPRLVNLLCDRSLLGGYVDQTHHIDKGTVKKAQKSLLGEDAGSAPSRSCALLKFFPPLRVILLMILFLFAVVILSDQNQRSPGEAPRPQSGASRQGSIIHIVPLYPAYKAALAGHVSGQGERTSGTVSQIPGTALQIVSTIDHMERLPNDPKGGKGPLWRE